MTKEYYFEIVEKVLKEFPLECSRNYYDNKDEVTIIEKEIIVDSLYGNYNNENNSINIYFEESLPHELFHMAFRDKRKVGKKVWPDDEVFYSNGVSFEKINDGHKIFYQQGLTEGFAEYLNRKCCNNYGQEFNYFFIDLLISIYGEEILKYPLQNNPKGFLLDERFYDIFSFSKSLDSLEESKQVIQLISSCKDTFEKILKIGTKGDCRSVLKIMDNTKENFRLSIISCFKNIINEYDNCKKPNIIREEFAKKMELFLLDSSYKMAFVFDDKKISVKDNVKILIDNFKKDNRDIKNILYKIKK